MMHHLVMVPLKAVKPVVPFEQLENRATVSRTLDAFLDAFPKNINETTSVLKYRSVAIEDGERESAPALTSFVKLASWSPSS